MGDLTFQADKLATVPKDTIVATTQIDGVDYQNVIVTTEGGITEWKDKRFDYTSGDLDYKGFSATHKAATDAGDLWYVWKYTWAGTDATRIQGPIICNYDDRAGEDW
jgi:hypothetical protein